MTVSSWSKKPVWNGKLNKVTTAFLIATPILAILFTILDLILAGFQWSSFLLMLVMYFATTMSITAGYHRLFSHRSYQTNAVIKFLYLLFGSAAMQNSAIHWSSDHRYHHRFVDQESDPYNINRGFFYAHMGWMFYSDPVPRNYENVEDLKRDRLVLLQHKFILPLSIFMCFAFPLLLGFIYGSPISALVWGGFLRLTLGHHVTFLINSASHKFGTQPYSVENTARDNFILAILTSGEGYHNFHHVFQADYRNGVLWYQWDPTKWLVGTLNFLGLARNLHRTPDWQILRAKVQRQYEDIQNKLDKKHHFINELERVKKGLEERIQRLAELKREFQAWKENKTEQMREERERQLTRLKDRIALEKSLLNASFEEFRATLLFLSKAKHI